MFGFMEMVGNYEDRVVGRHEYDHGFISTAAVTDGEKPYETAVSDSRYEDDRGDTSTTLVVESYDTKDAAEAGHESWVRLMTGDAPPDGLRECGNSGIASLGQELGVDFNQTRQG